MHKNAVINSAFFVIMGFIYYLLGAPLRGLNSVINNYAICMIIYLLLFRILYIFFDYFMACQKVRVLTAKPFLFKIKEKFLGREGNNFEDATLEIFKATGSNYFSTVIPILFEYPVIFGLFFTLYHPISVLFPSLRNVIPAMEDAAEKIVSGSFGEINIINAVKSSPEAFSGFDISGILKIQSSFWAFDIFKTASLKDITVVLPMLTVAFYLFSIIKLLIPVFKKEKKLRSVAFMLALYIIIGASITASAFSLPLVFYLYLFTFIVVGSISHKIIDAIVSKKRKDWVISTNKKCQDILRKYEIEDYVSAIPEKGESGDKKEN